MHQYAGNSCKVRENYSETHTRNGFEVEVYLDFINSRLKVKNYAGDNGNALAKYLVDLAAEKQLGKVLFNGREDIVPDLQGNGYRLEGCYPGFFNGVTAYGYSFFVDEQRSVSIYWDEEEEILESVRRKKPGSKNGRVLPSGLTMRVAGSGDAEELARLYSNTFSTYPSPLLDENYIREVMVSHVIFVGIFDGNSPVSAASAETDPANNNAEITDCATVPEFRGKGLLSFLIEFLEEEMRKRGIKCLYSLARAGSYGMNASLRRKGYEYTGRFVNNCHIGGRFEDMNLWVK